MPKRKVCIDIILKKTRYMLTRRDEMSKENIRGKICDIISRMLDNPDECGIYPTTVAYDELEKLITEEQIEGVGWGYANACGCLKRGGDPRSLSLPNLIDKWLKVKEGKTLNDQSAKT